MSVRMLSILAVLSIACTDTTKDTGSSSDSGDDATSELDAVFVDSTGAEIPDPSTCDEEYSFCGSLLVPEDFSGTPRSLALALYTSIPPAGPPDAILAEISAPSLGPGERYPVRLAPVVNTGEYYIWANLYIEGGGEWMPENGIDYTGATPAPVMLTGASLSFDDITMKVAEGW